MNKVNQGHRFFNYNLAGIYCTFCSNWRLNKEEYKSKAENKTRSSSLGI